MALPVLVINRDQDTERMAGFATSAEAVGTSFERVAALDAHAPDFPFHEYADLIGTHFWGQDEVKPGAIGCFLSHRRAWQTVVDRNLEMALICEDDARFHRRPAELETVVAGRAPLDILFVNDRLSAWAAAIGPREISVPLADVIRALGALGGAKAVGLRPTPGGDCYLVTGAGAARLLDLTRRHRIVCGVDWAMVWNALPGMTSEVAAAFPELGVLASHLAVLETPLHVAISTQPVAGQEKGLASTLRHSVRYPIAGLLAR